MSAQPRQTVDDIARVRPWEPEHRVQLRRRLNNARQRSICRRDRSISPDAHALFCEIARIAGDWSLKWQPDSDLESRLQDILDALTRMFLAADALERNGSGL